MTRFRKAVVWVSLMAAIASVFSIARTTAASARPDEHGSPAAHMRASRVVERCCFLLTVRASAHLIATYPDTRFPYGFHQMDVVWAGQEIVSYRETRGRPALAEVFAGGGARVRADVWEQSSWDVDVDQSLQCFVYYSTSATEFDSNFKDGWMKSESVLEFVQPKLTLDVYPGQLVSRIYGTHCGKGVDSHFENPSRAAWGGINQPYDWTFKSWARDRWLRSNVLTKSIPQRLTPTVLQPGGFYWLPGANSDGIVLVLQYFPPRQLAGMAKKLATTYPITSHGIKLLDDRE